MFNIEMTGQIGYKERVEKANGVFFTSFFFRYLNSFLELMLYAVLYLNINEISLILYSSTR